MRAERKPQNLKVFSARRPAAHRQPGARRTSGFFFFAKEGMRWPQIAKFDRRWVTGREEKRESGTEYSGELKRRSL